MLTARWMNWLGRHKTKDLKILGITDHGVNMPGGPHLYYFGNIRVIPGELYGVQILRGVEANICASDGSLDLPDRLLERLQDELNGMAVLYRYSTHIKRYTDRNGQPQLHLKLIGKAGMMSKYNPLDIQLVIRTEATKKRDQMP